MRFLGPLACKDREFILSFPEEQFQPLAYTTTPPTASPTMAGITPAGRWS